MPSDTSLNAILIAFGGFGATDGTHIEADQIYEALVGHGYWLAPNLPRVSRDIKPGMQVVFYQNRVGFRGMATISGIEPAKGADWQLPRSSFAALFQVKILLTEIHTFALPVPMHALVHDLQFVTNKQHWGHSVRSTPRLIPSKDLERIAAAVKR